MAPQALRYLQPLIKRSDDKQAGLDDGVESGVDAGAAGDSSGNAISISTGGLVAIVLVVAAVAIVGVCMAVLFYVAKKREWTIKQTIRRSARKVANAITPRRTEFPDSVKKGPISSSRRPQRHAQTQEINLEKGAPGRSYRV